MPEPIPIDLAFPTAGLVKSTGFAGQLQNTTASCLNVWPYHYPGGRVRGGTRPGRNTGVTWGGGKPLNWISASWVGGHGMAVCGENGSYTSINGTTWTQQIAQGTAGSDFASCAILNNELFQVSSADENVYYKNLATGVSGVLVADPNSDGIGKKGSVPKNCGIVHQHRGAIYMAGDVNNPQVLYRCALNDPRDWDTARPIEGAAWSSAGRSGQINRPIVAMITHGNGCMLVGHVDAITAVRGDPQIGGGGSIEELVQFSGPIMQSAWCKTASDHTVMLTRESLTIMSPGCGSPPITASRYKLPAELTAIDPGAGDTVSVAYDGRWNGIVILVTRYIDGINDEYSQFFYDLAGEGFWPMDFSVGQYRLAVSTPVLSSDTTGASVMLKSGSGAYFDTDSVESFSSHVYLGPVPLGNANNDGTLTSLEATLAEDSDPVDFEVYTGGSAQEAFNSATPKYSGTWSRQGYNYSSHVRARGNAAYIKLSGTTTDRWHIEQVSGEAYPVSRRRVMNDAP